MSALIRLCQILPAARERMHCDTCISIEPIAGVEMLGSWFFNGHAVVEVLFRCNACHSKREAEGNFRPITTESVCLECRAVARATLA